ncbi:putative sensory transduction regulator [Williamsia limnetica]|uniref:Putative sensory transduction regulator n=1 Tax=Williamsia limnetica TaxID=882452 RepID=A0A318RSX9_WILLI|nr:YbjN domain-containing protein [Williamsia limnetica]PYE20062.1 putative sensory transduction regulator [Williamsia limnetica]
MTSQVTTDLSGTIEDFLGERELTYSRKDSGGKDADYFVIELPGEKKLKTTVLLTVGPHGLRLEAFVCRKPDENHEGVYKWMLKRNRRLYGVAYTLDNAGDIYLVGRHSADSITAAELDRLLGQTLEAADGDFNVLLEIGFITSIRREWAWRVSRGESLNNLKAFEHLIEGHEPGGVRPDGVGVGRADGAGAPPAGGSRAESVVQNGVAPRDLGDDEDDVSDSAKA